MLLRHLLINHSINHPGFVIRDKNHAVVRDQNIHRMAQGPCGREPASDEIRFAQDIAGLVQPVAHHFEARGHAAVRGCKDKLRWGRQGRGAA
jgi:hypothetical protein